MRVIAGRFKGFALPSATTGTRPTTDRTKEAIFSRLDSWGLLEGTRVLDLFAGTGALGIEALSRGADELLAVESAGPVSAMIAKSLRELGHHRSWDNATMKARAMRKRAERFASGYRGPAFGVIFADPPYAFATEECSHLLADLAASSATDEATLVVLERSTRSQAPAVPAGWHLVDQRDYGETAVYYIEARPA